MRNYWWVCVVLLSVGCVEDEKPSSDSPSRDGALADAHTDGSDGDEGVTPDGAAADAAIDSGADGEAPTEDSAVDAGPDAAPDQMVPVDIDDCQAACDRVMACERFDVYPDADSCSAACERAGRSAPPATWFQCLEVEACTLLHLCRLPEPPPLTCDEVCAGLTECGGEAPFDCVAACEAQDDDGGFAQCGELLYGGACDTGRFWSCIGEQVYPDCAVRCEVGVQCNVLRPDDCVLECIGEMGDADPLRALRARQMNQCIRAAQEDCRRVDACVNIEDVPGPVVVNRQTFCEEWNRCFEDFIPCDFIWEELPNGEQAAACVVQELRANGCPPDPAGIFQQCLEGQPGPVGPGCNELCEAQTVCGLIDPDADQFACARECNEALRDGDEEEMQRISALFPCGLAGSCDALTECLEENSPVASCAAHCARLDGCGLADEDCVPRCDARFFRARDTAYRACVQDAADCPAVEACYQPPILDCARLCARTAECGLDAAECADECDDDLFQNPRESVHLAACIMVSPTCQGPAPSFASCGRDTSPGARCARYCLALNQCAPDAAEAMTDCIESCGDGYIEDEAIRFAAAGPCLDDLEGDAECAAFEACIPDPVAPDCAGWCGALEGCDAAPLECGARCPEDTLARIRSFEQLACVGEEFQCDDVEDCLGDDGPIEAQGGDEAAFCRIWEECRYENFGPCDEVVVGMPDAIRHCLINELQFCPDVPFDAFERCDREAGQGDGMNAAVMNACIPLCHAMAQCGEGEEEATIRSCAADCYQTITAGAQEDALRLQAFLNCRAALSCGALDTCLAANSPEEACDAYCGALDGCGLAAEDCGETCDAGFFRDRNEAARVCVLEAAGDCEAIAACAPGHPLPCAYVCDRAEGCGMGDADCVSQCDDDHYDDPIQTGREFACAATAPRCTGLAQNALSGCGGDEAAGAECWSYCWARTGCDATQGETLGACLIECGEGFVGAEGLRFEAARGCIQNAVLDPAGCPEVADCIPDEVPVDCAPWCSGLDDCEVFEGCAERCPEDGLSRLHVVTDGPCVQDAEDDCEAVEACGVSPEPVEVQPPNPNDFCAAYGACGFNNFLPCQQLIQVVANQPGGLECLMENINPCPRDPIELFNQCLNEGNQPPPQRVDYGPVCAEMCRAQATCELAPTHARDCAAACIRGLQNDAEGLLGDLVSCRDALSCPDLADCSQGAFGEDCDAPCNRYLDCGGEGFADLAACRAACNDSRLDPRARPDYLERVDACLVEFLGEDEDDIAACAAEGLECFTPGLPAGLMTCEEVCPAMLQCEVFGGQNADDCVQGCRQADLEDPVGNEAIRACLTEALDDGQCDMNILEQCFELANPNDREPEDRPVPDRPDVPPPPPEP